MNQWLTSAPRQVLWLSAALVTIQCGAEPRRGDGRTQVLVSAAASLTDAFTELSSAFEEAHPGFDVVLNLSGSSTLREQILSGAPADVFASADVANMERVVSAGVAKTTPRPFAANRMRIAVPRRNPAGVTGLSDFAREELFLGLCAIAAPCGDLARNVLDNAGVLPSIDTNEPHVRALLTKVETAELDAAIVYTTDVASAGGRVEGVDIPDTDNVVAEYPIVVLAGGLNPEGAAAFVTFVLSDAGQSILRKYEFLAP